MLVRWCLDALDNNRWRSIESGMYKGVWDASRLHLVCYSATYERLKLLPDIVAGVSHEDRLSYW